MTDNATVHTIHIGSWGVVLPRDTGVTYIHQSGGVACHQKQFEGIFIPISRPKTFTDNHEMVDLLDELRVYDYEGDDSRCELDWEGREELWSTITEELPFKFTNLTEEAYKDFETTIDMIPDGYPKFGSWEWIRIEGVKTKDSAATKMSLESWPEKLEGEVVCLLYPNSD